MVQVNTVLGFTRKAVAAGTWVYGVQLHPPNLSEVSLLAVRGKDLRPWRLLGKSFTSPSGVFSNFNLQRHVVPVIGG